MDTQHHAKCARRDGPQASTALEALEESGVIGGYTTILTEGEEDGFTAFVRITLERQSEDAMRRFELAVRRHPEIVECYLMTGDADYMLRTSAASAGGYEAIHTEILSRLPGVARIHSSIALRNALRPRGKA
ncbi:MAG: Lrp/AsnC ligand binding domain-containing protein [Proteobacteria bacterium]|nr:Lrp/AsnC ligand binding domain-containing protein [Pseudomonadota bacterium]